VDLAPVKLTLPIGISFYTFQTVSYDIDLLRGNAALQKNFGRFLLFVSLFPQLIAGPILRYKDIEAQLTDRAATKEKFCGGIVRFLCGCAKVCRLNRCTRKNRLFLADFCYRKA